MAADFETFARERILQLRSEADTLEAALRAFAGNASAPQRETTTYRQPAAGSAFGAVVAGIKAAGAEGLTIKEMVDAAALTDVPVRENTLRSQLWTAVKKGTLERMDNGRYRVPSVYDLSAGSWGPVPASEDDEEDPNGGL